jgi:hypothetical protein
LGRAIAQVVSHRLPIAAAQVQSKVKSRGIRGGKMALGQVFFEHFISLCQYSFRQIRHTHLSSRAGTVGQLMADVPSGLGLVPHQKIKKKNTSTLLVIWDLGPVVYMYIFNI